ncbi:hypothetical protein E2C01_043230 [Portunus trituberculatus]|uniref:DUF7047 domain-containing protein n=1 Tax=Portunus trituberculatus TaxID=210409 RepID=A0A5B7FPQ7_PORTR|nr:hypothetical protein [Portunus trituberculatus]
MSKLHQLLVNGMRALGLRVQGGAGETGMEVGHKFVGHYPICGWVRVVTAFIKRKVNEATERWNDIIVDEEIRRLLREIIAEVRNNNLLQGQWSVSSYQARVWVDTRSLALGIAVEINGYIVEDASWLRKEDISGIGRGH